MLFDSAEDKCTYNLLNYLKRNKTANYSTLYKVIKVSHSTLQSSLKKLMQKGFISQGSNPKKIKDYSIRDKGIELLELLEKIAKLQ